ncbi:MAG: ATP-grasp domain-containing protein [Acidimicrobiales bacterium]
MGPLPVFQSLRESYELAWVVEGMEELGALRRLLARLGSVIDASQNPEAEVIRRLEDAGAQGIATFTDAQLPLTRRLGEALGLPVNSAETVAALTDKCCQRRALSSAGVPTPDFVQLDASVGAEAMARAAGSIRYPAVLKPARGSGSRHTIFAVSAEEAVNAALDAARNGRTTSFILEGYLVGRSESQASSIADFVSAESFVADGEVTTIGVTGRFAFAEPFRETGHILPACIDSRDLGAVLDLAEAGARALGVRVGALHTEMKLTAEGPRIVEVNGRLGGFELPDLYLAAGGPCFYQLLALSALPGPHSLRNEPTVLRAEGRSDHWFRYFLVPPMGARRLRAIRGLGAVKALAGIDDITVRKAPGDSVDWQQGTLSAVLFVRGHAQTEDRLRLLPALIERVADVDYEMEGAT